MIEFYKIYLVDNAKSSVMIITEATKQKGRDKHGAGGKRKARKWKRQGCRRMT